MMAEWMMSQRNKREMATIIATYLCIGCPLGCRLEVEEEDERILAIRGFSCKRGKEYAAQEHTDPRRIVTTTVGISGGRWARLPVKTTAAVPKGRVRALCEALRPVRVRAPVHMGDTIVADILGLGVDMVATRDMPEADRDEAGT
jgi:CxxC motif-containing protein